MNSVAIPDARDQLRGVIAQRRQIFGHEPTVEQANAFLAGFDLACSYFFLRDFHQWLVVKLGGGYNLHWFGLARNLALGLGPYEIAPIDATEEGAGQRVLELVIEFLDDVDGLDGRRKLYARYEEQLAADDLE